MLDKLKEAVWFWRDTVQAHFQPEQPPIVGWTIPYLGCGLSFGLGGPRWLQEQHDRLGSPFTIYVKGQRFTISQDPEFMARFYAASVEDVSFYAGVKTFPGIGELVPLGASGPEGANVGLDTLRQFLPAKILSAAEELDAEAALCLKECLVTGRGELFSMLRRTIVRITVLLLAGPRLARNERFLDALCEFDDALLRLVATMFGSGALKQGLAARSRLMAELTAELRRRRQESYEGAPRDVADALRAARTPEGSPLSDEVMATDLFGYMFATTANTPAAAAMCLLHILVDPALKQRILDEQECSRRAHGEVLSMAALKEMPLLNACYQETLRRYAPAMHVRMTLKPMQIGRYTVPARSMIAFSPYILHHDPNIYTDPEVFDLERFLQGPRKPAKGPSSNDFLPFGRGVHACLGRNLARQEIMLCVARLLRGFSVELEPCKEPLALSWFTNGIAIPRGPRMLRVKPRIHDRPAQKASNSTAAPLI